MFSLMSTGGDGRAVLAPWIIRMLAGAFAVGAMSWMTWVTTHQYANAQEVSLIKQHEQDHFDILLEKIGNLSDQMKDLKEQVKDQQHKERSNSESTGSSPRHRD